MPRRAATGTPRPARTQRALSRERILAVAVELADEDGLETLSMRRLGQRLGVDPMSLYNHVRDKEDLLDGLGEAIVGEIDAPPAAADWRGTLRATILAARATMLRHPWAAAVIESRVTPGPATMRHMERVLRTLRDGGFSVDLAHHALHVLGSRVLGFSQDLFDDRAADEPDPEEAARMARTWATAFPAIAELAMAVRHDGGLGGCDDDVEFAFGLDLILDGLEQRRIAAGGVS
jgi:AcrR family transcriptional regulator